MIAAHQRRGIVCMLGPEKCLEKEEPHDFSELVHCGICCMLGSETRPGKRGPQHLSAVALDACLALKETRKQEIAALQRFVIACILSCDRKPDDQSTTALRQSTWLTCPSARKSVCPSAKAIRILVCPLATRAVAELTVLPSRRKADQSIAAPQRCHVQKGTRQCRSKALEQS